MLAVALFLAAFSPTGDPVFEKLIGEWTSVEESIRPDGSKVPFTLTGINRMVLGGSMLQIEEELSLPVGRRSHNLILMRGEGAGYKVWWHTDREDKPAVFEGKADGNKLTLTSETLKIEYEFVKDGFYRAQLLVKSGETWRVATTAEYTRKK
jgi:hypothetical protein